MSNLGIVTPEIGDTKRNSRELRSRHPIPRSRHRIPDSRHRFPRSGARAPLRLCPPRNSCMIFLSPMEKIAIVPAYNEEASLPAVLRASRGGSARFRRRGDQRRLDRRDLGRRPGVPRGAGRGSAREYRHRRGRPDGVPLRPGGRLRSGRPGGRRRAARPSEIAEDRRSGPVRDGGRGDRLALRDKPAEPASRAARSAGPGSGSSRR